MTDKKIFQLVPAKKQYDDTGMTEEMRKVFDEMIGEILNEKQNFILMVDDGTGSGLSFLTNLDQPNANMLIDRVKFHGLMYAEE